jgi:hypothetical protein
MAKIKPLTEKDFHEYIYKVFTSVFTSNDPFNKPIASSLYCRAILYPIAYKLETIELQAVALAAQAVGDNGFYLTVTERPNEVEQDRPYHWYIPVEDLESYYKLSSPFVLENTLYSHEGKWGMIISHEQHAVIGGSDLFLDTLFSHLLVSADQQLTEFLSTWKENYTRFQTDIAWLPELLAHVYGEEKAKVLLMQVGLMQE